jgi:hypothetical protein
MKASFTPEGLTAAARVGGEKEDWRRESILEETWESLCEISVLKLGTTPLLPFRGGALWCPGRRSWMMDGTSHIYINYS